MIHGSIAGKYAATICRCRDYQLFTQQYLSLCPITKEQLSFTLTESAAVSCIGPICLDARSMVQIRSGSHGSNLNEWTRFNNNYSDRRARSDSMLAIDSAHKYTQMHTRAHPYAHKQARTFTTIIQVTALHLYNR